MPYVQLPTRDVQNKKVEGVLRNTLTLGFKIELSFFGT